MRISTKVTASSALFVLLLGGVLYYHLTSIGSQVVDHSQASALNFEAATLALELVRLVRDQGEMVRKFRVTKDADYGTRWAEIEAELTAGLEELKQLDLAPPSDRQAALVLQTWSEMRSHAAYRLVQAMATAAEHNRNAEDPAVDEASRDIPDSVEALANLEQPLVEEFDLATESAVLPPADSIEAESAADCDEEAAGDAIDAKLCRDFAKLGKQVEALLDATRASIGRQVEIASRSSFEVRTVSNNVALFALVLIVLISALTAHSIQAPLKRFTAGTRAVAEGNFFYHLDETTGDEFAELAVAFNSMAQRLGDLDRLKREFLAHVSHELKTPLVAMQETNTLLLEHLAGPLNDKQRRIVSLNLDSARRLSAMISNLLDISRMEAGTLEYDFKENDLVEIVELVREELAGRMREKGLWLEADLSGRPLMIHGDRDRLIQVVENLYENAVKFSAVASTLTLAVSTIDELPDHLPVRWKELSAPRNGCKSALLAISDSGPGVPDDHKEKIFEKFHQVEKSQKKGLRSGVGLGLAISREIVEAHRGALWVRDNPQVGSTFFLLLPIDRRRVTATMTQIS